MAVTEENKSAEYLDMEGLQLYDSLIKAKITTDLNTNKYDDTALKAKVTANETAITTLNGEGEGSVKKQIIDEVAKIIADSAMNSQINTNKADISNLKTLVGTLPEGSASTNIVAYIAEAIGTSQTELTNAIATAKSEAVSTAAVDATTKSDKSLDDAKTYADSKIKELADGQVGTNKTDIASLKTKIETLESVYTPITESQINSLFSD